jgi:hypothetical protein
MIFHTTCDELYFYRFYESFWRSIKENNPVANFSLNYVGSKNAEILEFCKNNNIILSTEEITLVELKNKFNLSTDNDVLGYYSLCRWKSIPVVDENVIVCDVDILAINKIDIDLVDELLNKHQVVNITRIKPNGLPGGMMSIVLSKTVTGAVKKMANDHCQLLTNSIAIGEDVYVRDFIYQNLNVYELNGKVLDLSKPKYKINEEWFVFAKGGQGENSVKKLKRLYDNLEILKNNKFIE